MTMEALASHPNLPTFVEEIPGAVGAFDAAKRRVAAEVDDWRGDAGVAIRRRRLGFAPPNARNANGGEGGDDAGVPGVPRVPPTECEAIAAGCARLGLETPEAWRTPPASPGEERDAKARRETNDEAKDGARGEANEDASRDPAEDASRDPAEDASRDPAEDASRDPAEDASQYPAPPRIDLAELPPVPPRRA